MLNLDLNKDDVFIDIGANEGYFSILMGNKGIKSYGVEPSPADIVLFENNIDINNLHDNVKVLPYAAGHYNGEIEFKENIFNRMWSSVDSGRVNFMNKTIVVPIKRIDEMIPDRNKVKLIKIDVEGYEENVIDGLSFFLDQPVIWIIEIDTADPVFNKIYNIFIDRGYYVKSIDLECIPFKWNKLKCKEICLGKDPGMFENTIKNIIFIPPVTKD